MPIHIVAQDDYTALIHRKDGTVFSLSASQIDSVTFVNTDADPSWQSIDIEATRHSAPVLFVHYETEPTTTLSNGESAAHIYINQHLNPSTDYGMKFGNKTGTINKNFDFENLYLLEGGCELPSTVHTTHDSSYNTLAGHDTDYIVAMRLGAVNDVNGDFPESKQLFTGGFHGYMSETSGNFTPTMREVSKQVYANGARLLPGTSLYCDSVRIEVVNLIQGANTEKRDGSGRNVLLQRISISCNGGDYNVSITLTPLEDIYFYQVNGLCFFNDFKQIQFLGSQTKRSTYSSGQVVRADRCVHTIRQFNDKFNFDVFINSSFSHPEWNEDTYNASSESAHKCYFNFISSAQGLYAPRGSIYTFKGGYRFSERE